jgi:hypothetical protein
VLTESMSLRNIPRLHDTPLNTLPKLPSPILSSSTNLDRATHPRSAATASNSLAASSPSTQLLVCGDQRQKGSM